MSKYTCQLPVDLPRYPIVELRYFEDGLPFKTYTAISIARVYNDILTDPMLLDDCFNLNHRE